MKEERQGEREGEGRRREQKKTDEELPSTSHFLGRFSMHAILSLPVPLHSGSPNSAVRSECM